MRGILHALATLPLAAAVAFAHAAGPGAAAGETLPIFDAHLHYNWEPAPHYPLEKVLALFRAQRVTGILANSRPNDGTRALLAVTGKDLWVVGFVRPYRTRADLGTWFNDSEIFALIQREFARGGYQGIGEFHLSGTAADTPWVKKTVDFAVDRQLWLHAHADEEALAILYRHNAQAKIIWAHTGFSTAPAQVAALLERHPTLVGELSYRYGITDDDGRLTPEWRALFERYPDRFLLGSDTWVNERWDSYGRTMAEYRGWLRQLPPAVAEQIAWRTAERLFRK